MYYWYMQAAYNYDYDTSVTDHNSITLFYTKVNA